MSRGVSIGKAMAMKEGLRATAAAAVLTFALAGPAVLAAEGLERALELMQRQDFAAAAPILKRLAEEGHADAQGYYGGLLLAGVPGVPHDPAAARSWLEKAAGGGNALAAFNLGLMNEQGDGTPADVGQAFRWYEAAARRGPKPR